MRFTRSSLPKAKNRTQSTINPSHPGRKAFLRVVRHGSLTVEAAWTMPLFFLAAVCLICMMDLFGVTAREVVCLQEQAETAGSVLSVGGTSLPSIIDLPGDFSYSPAWYPATLPTVRIRVRGRIHTWTGRDRSETTADSAKETEELVYVSDYQSVYHTHSSCTHLSLSVRSVSGTQVEHLHNQYGASYHACEKCVGFGGKNAQVYITEEGDHYHNDVDCAGLHRSVRLVKKSEVEGLPLCSRCALKEAA